MSTHMSKPHANANTHVNTHRRPSIALAAKCTANTFIAFGTLHRKGFVWARVQTAGAFPNVSFSRILLYEFRRAGHDRCTGIGIHTMFNIAYYLSSKLPCKMPCKCHAIYHASCLATYCHHATYCTKCHPTYTIMAYTLWS